MDIESKIRAMAAIFLAGDPLTMKHLSQLVSCEHLKMNNERDDSALTLTVNLYLKPLIKSNSGTNK